MGAWDRIASGVRELDEKALPPMRMPVSLGALARPGTALAEFPVLVRLAPSNFPYGDARSDGLDIRFRGPDGTTELAFERESWNSGGVSDFWVKVPVLAAAPEDTVVYIYYGGPVAQDGSNPPAVWSNGYLAVLHGGYWTDADTGVRFYADSLGNSHPGSPAGTHSAPGDLSGLAKPAGSYGFGFGRGSPTFKNGVVFPQDGGLDDLGPMTFEAWIMDRATPADRYLFYKGGSFFATVQPGGTIRFRVGHAAVPLVGDSPAGFFAGSIWTHIALAWDGASGLSLYSDGVGQAPSVTGPSGARNSDAGNPLVIGNNSGPTPPTYTHLIADLDEIRISGVVRTAEWIGAQYLSQQGSHLVFGDPEEVPDAP